MIEHDEGVHDAFEREVETLTIGSSPTAAVMKDGAALRTKRRAAFVSGAAALAVLPVAAVAVFAGGGTKSDVAQSATSGAATSTAQPTPGPAPITVTASAAGQVNPDLPNDQVVVLESGTFQGKPWRLVRDRYVVAVSPDEIQGKVRDTAYLQPHIPFDRWGKPGTTECEGLGIQWGDKAPGSSPDYDAGDDCAGGHASLDAVFGLVNVMSVMNGPEQSEVVGRVDAARVASVTVSCNGVVSQKLPVAVVSGEKNGYFAAVAPPAKTGSEKIIVTTYDAQGVELGHQDFSNPPHPAGPPSQPPTSTTKK